MKKIAIHVSFFYIESRIQYVNRIIEATNQYDCVADIFIHTNIPDVDENPDSLCEAKREVGFRRNAGVSPTEEEMRRSLHTKRRPFPREEEYSG